MPAVHIRPVYPLGDVALPLLLTCVVFGLQMHVTKLMDVANVHLFFVNLRFVKVL